MIDSLRIAPKVTAILMTLLSPVGVFAATGDLYTYSLAQAPLAETLLSIARQSKENISFAPDLVKGYQSRSVQGALTVEQAITTVLEGTDLQFTRTSNGTLTIIRKPVLAALPPEADSQLPQIEVTARQERGYAADSATAATRTDTSLLELPRSVSTVSRELMKDQNVRTVVDALRNVSGVTASGAMSGTNPSRIQIRGFSVDNAMSDGMMSSGRYGFGVPAIALERIEVVKGPEGIVGGRAARFGGIVNMISKKPESYNQRELQTLVDSNGTAQIGLDMTGPLTEDKRLRGRLIGMKEHGADTDLGWNGGEDNYLSPQLAWVDGGTKVLFGSELQNKTRPYANHVYTFSNHLDDSAQTIPHARDDHAEYRTRRYYMDMSHNFDNDWQLSLRGQYSNQKAEISNWAPNLLLNYAGDPPGTPGFPDGLPAGDTISATARKQALDYKSRTLQTTLSKSFALGFTDHDVLIGYDVFNGESRHKASKSLAFAAFPAGETQILPSVDNYAYIPSFEDSYKSKETGYFIQDQISFAERWNVLASARRVSYRSPNDPMTEPLDKWLYGLGITYQVIPGISTYVSYSEGVTNTFGYPTKNGAALPPTEAKQYETGAKFAFYDERLILTTALFRIQETNVPMPDPANPSFYYTEKGLESSGVEVEVRGRITPKLNLSMAYSNIKLENMEDGSPSIGSPRQHFNLWTTYQFAERWSVGGGVDARSSIKTTSVNPGRYLIAPGQARFDAMLRYETNSWSATLGVQNLTNKRLYDDYILYTSTEVQPERTFTLSTTLKF